MSGYASWPVLVAVSAVLALLLAGVEILRRTFEDDEEDQTST